MEASGHVTGTNTEPARSQTFIRFLVLVIAAVLAVVVVSLLTPSADQTPTPQRPAPRVIVNGSFEVTGHSARRTVDYSMTVTNFSSEAVEVTYSAKTLPKGLAWKAAPSRTPLEIPARSQGRLTLSFQVQDCTQVQQSGLVDLKVTARYKQGAPSTEVHLEPPASGGHRWQQDVANAVCP